MVEHVSANEARKLIAKAKPKGRSKYGAKKTVVDGITFDSMAEAKRYGELKALERGGLIAGLQVHPKFEAVVNGIVVCKYTADFSYLLPFDPVFDGPGAQVSAVEDVKSEGTRRARDWSLKKRLVEAACGITITEVIR